MLMEFSTPSTSPILDLPADLRTRFDARELASFAIEAVHRVKPGSSVFLHNGQMFSESMMLTVLTYCYAAGIYGSSEVEQMITDDETVRYLCARVFPDSEDLRQFRRRHASLIKHSLIQLFAIADHKLHSSSDDYLTYANLSLGQSFALGRAWEFTAEAERRVTRAIQADSIAMDA